MASPPFSWIHSYAVNMFPVLHPESYPSTVRSCSALSSTCFARRPEITVCASIVSVDVYAQHDAQDVFWVCILPITSACAAQSKFSG